MRLLVFALVFTLVFGAYPEEGARFEVRNQYELLGIASDSLFQVQVLEGRTYAFTARARCGELYSPPSMPLYAFWIGETAFPDTILVNSYLDYNLNGVHDFEDLVFFADTLSLDLSLFAHFAEFYYKSSSRIYLRTP